MAESTTPYANLNYEDPREFSQIMAALDQQLRDMRVNRENLESQRSLEDEIAYHRNVQKGIGLGLEKDAAKNYAAKEVGIIHQQRQNFLNDLNARNEAAMERESRMRAPATTSSPYRQLSPAEAMEMNNVRPEFITSSTTPGTSSRSNARPSPPRSAPAFTPPSPANSSTINSLAKAAMSQSPSAAEARSQLQTRAAAGDPQAMAVANFMPQQAKSLAANKMEYNPAVNSGWRADGSLENQNNKPLAPNKYEYNPAIHSGWNVDRERNPGKTPEPPKRTESPKPKSENSAPPVIVTPSNSKSNISSQGGQILIGPRRPQNQFSAPGPQKPQQGTPTRQPARPAASGPAKKPAGGGGGGRGGGSKQPPLTAKQRNAMADEAASKAARRADSRGISDSAYRNANQDSATWRENETARRERLEKAGLNPDYEGWKDNPNYEKDVADANKRAWDNFNNNQKEQEKQAARKKVADDYKEALKQGGFTDDLGNWHDAKNPDGSASNALLGHTQNQRKMVHAYGNKHSSVMVAARPGNP